MNKQITIRWATQDDSEDLIHLNDLFNGVRMELNEVKESLRTSSELVALAFLDHRAVGFACAQYFKSFCYPDLYAEITEMYVSEHARRRGIASLLLGFIEEELREKGVKNVKLLTGLKNETALKTYAANGYIIRDDAVMKKKLSNHS
ncbi:GNAT family N-acetyltransferase [Paenibacillus thalictri]|uniref:GNAT family N-acetyltransferase n=1 Tax=Paenibacillus thalictri TaxID=2527873 RepID=A0A4Q9DVB6_9BACL|nr:GNAT family N-acetyltransferase [Paenibacillus thalictri]TBL78921.1 GNAT family N-acetyltransferase [Paenibacillus thalictri]